MVRRWWEVGWWWMNKVQWFSSVSSSCHDTWECTLLDWAEILSFRQICLADSRNIPIANHCHHDFQSHHSCRRRSIYHHTRRCCREDGIDVDGTSSIFASCRSLLHSAWGDPYLVAHETDVKVPAVSRNGRHWGSLGIDCPLSATSSVGHGAEWFYLVWFWSLELLYFLIFFLYFHFSIQLTVSNSLV